MDDWKRERVELSRRQYLRKITDAAENRMRTRTAKEQMAEAFRRGEAPEDLPEPDADDSSLRGMLR